MTHSDSCMQELVELLHGAIRSLSDREVVYDVQDRFTYYVVQVCIQGYCRRIQVAKEDTMYSQWWADTKHQVVRQFITNWYEQMPAPVRAEDIKYMTHPDFAANTLSSVDEAKAVVRAKYPLAYQDYLGHIWTDDLYNCDSHCLQCTIEGPYNTWRQRFDAAWIGAKEHLQ